MRTRLFNREGCYETSQDGMIGARPDMVYRFWIIVHIGKYAVRTTYLFLSIDI